MLRLSVLFAFIAVSVAGVDDRTRVAVEAILRLEATNLAGNPKLEHAITNVLGKTRGTADFVRLVEKFHFTNQNEGLIDVARAGTPEAGAQAMQLVLSSGDVATIRQALHHTNSASKVAIALANTEKKEAVPLLLPVLTNARFEAAVRKQVLRSLAAIEDGAAAVLQMARDGNLPEDLTFTASSELNHARWPEIKTEAMKILPLPQLQNSSGPLPPISVLAKQTGNAANGSKVFRGPTAGCANCHRVAGEGVEVGPDLSEIGTKLGKDALYESILDPSAGISFGYEAWQVTLASGDEAFGIIVSETADDLALKAATGIVTRYKKSDVTKREKMKLSIMPAGLQQGMTVEDIVDLVEYLSSLKKKAE